MFYNSQCRDLIRVHDSLSKKKNIKVYTCKQGFVNTVVYHRKGKSRTAGHKSSRADISLECTNRFAILSEHENHWCDLDNDKAHIGSSTKNSVINATVGRSHRNRKRQRSGECLPQSIMNIMKYQIDSNSQDGDIITGCDKGEDHRSVTSIIENVSNNLVQKSSVSSSKVVKKDSPVKGISESDLQGIISGMDDHESSSRCSIDVNNSDGIVKATLEGSNIVKRVNILDITNKSKDLLCSLAQQDEPFGFLPINDLDTFNNSVTILHTQISINLGRI